MFSLPTCGNSISLNQSTVFLWFCKLYFSAFEILQLLSRVWLKAGVVYSAPTCALVSFIWGQVRLFFPRSQFLDIKLSPKKWHPISMIVILLKINLAVLTYFVWGCGKGTLCYVHCLFLAFVCIDCLFVCLLHELLALREFPWVVFMMLQQF